MGLSEFAEGFGVLIVLGVLAVLGLLGVLGILGILGILIGFYRGSWR